MFCQVPTVISKYKYPGFFFNYNVSETNTDKNVKLNTKSAKKMNNECILCFWRQKKSIEPEMLQTGSISNPVDFFYRQK